METKEFNRAISRKKAAQERRAEAKREGDRVYYEKNKDRKISQVKQRRKRLQSEKSIQPLMQRIAQKMSAKEKNRNRLKLPVWQNKKEERR